LEHPQRLDSVESVSSFYTVGFERLAIPQEIPVTLYFMVGRVSGFHRLFAQCALSSHGYYSPD
jgi:hypothetical protein